MNKILNIGICGSTGRVGKELVKIINHQIELYYLAGTYNSSTDQTNLSIMCKNSDIVIDFSSAKLLVTLLESAISNKTKLVIGTTGFNKIQEQKLESASKSIPIFYSANMSFVVYVMNQLVAKAAKLLKDYDVEIIESHHRNKLDSPSGTAIMFGDTIAKIKGKMLNQVACSRISEPRKSAQEIGFSSVRAGSIIGKHEVLFGGDNEVFTLKHEAINRNIFAHGALIAANWISTVKNPGLYSFSHIYQDDLE